VESVLIVSHTEKSIAFFNDLLTRDLYSEIIPVQSCDEAKRLLLERDFDLCVINSPLADEFGTEFALQTASKGICQVIFLVKNELYDEICSKLEDEGVFVLAKPVNRQLLWNALKMAGAAHGRLSRLARENRILVQKLEDLRFIDRAKCMLIEHYKLTESEAHRYIEKQAMDKRITRRQVADMVIRSVENEV
jgi:response regulator NasT